MKWPKVRVKLRFEKFYQKFKGWKEGSLREVQAKNALIKADKGKIRLWANLYQQSNLVLFSYHAVAVFCLKDQIYPDLTEQVMFLSSCYWPYYLVVLFQNQLVTLLYKPAPVTDEDLFRQKALETHLIKLIQHKQAAGEKLGISDKRLINERIKLLK